MGPEVINLLINAGIAGLFAAFALYLTRMFIAFIEKQRQDLVSLLDKERSQRDRTMEAAQSSLNLLTQEVTKLVEAVNVLESQVREITQPTPAKRPKKVTAEA